MKNKKSCHNKPRSEQITSLECHIKPMPLLPQCVYNPNWEQLKSGEEIRRDSSFTSKGLFKLPIGVSISIGINT